MKFTRKIKRAFNIISTLIPKSHQSRNAIVTFEIKVHSISDKTPLDYAIYEILMNVAYQDLIALKDFFQWATIEMLQPDQFFHTA